MPIVDFQARKVLLRIKSLQNSTLPGAVAEGTRVTAQRGVTAKLLLEAAKSTPCR